jgi:hypothetical protein
VSLDYVSVYIVLSGYARDDNEYSCSHATVPSIAGKFVMKVIIGGESILNISSTSFVYPLDVAVITGPDKLTTLPHE